MDQVVLDQAQQPYLHETATLAVSYPSSWASFFIESASNSSSIASICHDSCGWGPFDANFHLTSCFIDGILYGAINLFLLLFGTYQIYSLSSRHPLPSPLDWHFFTKLVSWTSSTSAFLETNLTLDFGLRANCFVLLFGWPFPFLWPLSVVFRCGFLVSCHFRSGSLCGINYTLRRTF